MVKTRLKKKYRVGLISIFMIICIGVFCYSLIQIIHWKKDVNSNRNIKHDIEEHITIDKNTDAYKIDFKALKETNDDTVAYLKVNGTNIDYVVVKGKDNSYYLTHNFNKEYNVAGWIFADYHNTFDGDDRNVVIYGHNTRDGSMFETLIYVLDRTWQKNIDNHIIIFITEQGKYKYQVFSTYFIEPEDYYINTIFNSDNEYNQFIDTIKSRTNYDYGVEVGSGDKVLTLSSCIGTGKKRVVLHAKLIGIE